MNFEKTLEYLHGDFGLAFVTYYPNQPVPINILKRLTVDQWAKICRHLIPGSDLETLALQELPKHLKTRGNCKTVLEVAPHESRVQILTLERMYKLVTDVDDWLFLYEKAPRGGHSLVRKYMIIDALQEKELSWGDLQHLFENPHLGQDATTFVLKLMVDQASTWYEFEWINERAPRGSSMQRDTLLGMSRTAKTQNELEATCMRAPLGSNLREELFSKLLKIADEDGIFWVAMNAPDKSDARIEALRKLSEMVHAEE